MGKVQNIQWMEWHILERYKYCIHGPVLFILFSLLFLATLTLKLNIEKLAHCTKNEVSH